MDIKTDATHGFTAYWRIENFPYMPKKHFSLSSPVFKISNSKMEWQLEIKLNKEFLAVYLFKEKYSPHINMTLSVSMLTGSGWTSVLNSAKAKFGKGRSGWGVHELLNLDRLEYNEFYYLPNGSLTLKFHIWNSKIKEETAQVLMISRIINDESSPHHRSIEYFVTLKPEDLLFFPFSYSFQTNEEPKSDTIIYQLPQTAKSGYIKDTEISFNDSDDGGEVSVNDAADDETGDNLNDAEDDDTGDNPNDAEVTIHNAEENSNDGGSFDAAKNIIHDTEETDDAEDTQRFKDTKFKFVTIRTLRKDFYVHKAVLCAKSTVWNSMFEMKMGKKNNCVIDVDDINWETMTLLVDFLYFETLGGIDWKAIVKLYYAADKYKIDQLKEACDILLKTKLTNKKIYEAFILADKYKDENLQKYAQDYFCKHSKIIMRSGKWKDFQITHPKLIPKILRKLEASL